MIDKEGRARTLKALALLVDNVQNNTVSTSAATLICAAGDIERGEALPGNEVVGGLVLVLCGEERNCEMFIEGGFLPQLAYGALFEAQMQLWSSSQASKFEAPIQSMVADMLSSAAQIEKRITKPTEQ